MGNFKLYKRHIGIFSLSLRSKDPNEDWEYNNAYLYVGILNRAIQIRIPNWLIVPSKETALYNISQYWRWDYCVTEYGINISKKGIYVCYGTQSIENGKSKWIYYKD